MSSEDSTILVSSHEVLLAAPSDSVVSVDSFPTDIFSWFSTSFESGTSCCSDSLASALGAATILSEVAASESSAFPFPVFNSSDDSLPVVSTTIEAASSFSDLVSRV